MTSLRGDEFPNNEDDESDFSSYDDDADEYSGAQPLPADHQIIAAAEDSNPNPNLLYPDPNPNLEGLAPYNPSFSDAGLIAVHPPPDRKRRRRSSAAAASEEARRIFQKLWTDEDEIALLQGFLDFTSQRGTTYSDYQYDTAPFFDQIRPRLKIDFNRNQLAEKLRRLKRKYRNAVNRSEAGKKSVFKSPHDLATFDISRKIWNTSFSRARKPKSTDRTPIPHADLSQDFNAEGPPQLLIREGEEEEEEEEGTVEVTVKDSIMLPPSSLAPISSIVDETVKSCLSPLFKELLHCAINGPSFSAWGIPNATGVGASPNPFQLNLPITGAPMDDRWKKQQILELEVFLKRTELVQEQIKSALEQLKSTDGGAD